MNKYLTPLLLIAIFLIGCTGVADQQADDATLTADAVAAAVTSTPIPTSTATATPTTEPSPTITPTATATELPWSTGPHPLQIEVMRQQSYPGSEITFEQTLTPGGNYSRYIVSYLSDGYKIYALMTVPYGQKPDTGWPVIVFNHGYIDPTEYTTTERYVVYVDALASRGYIVFNSDFRGHGNSEGDPEEGGGYGLPGYTVDVLNAAASLKAYEDADPNRIGMWGHSMGGQVTLRAMVVSDDIKAGVIWGGVVAPYPDIIDEWAAARHGRGDSSHGPPAWSANRESEPYRWGRSFNTWVDEFTTTYGTADQNPDFWATISPNTYLADLSGPVQLHHSITDETVPVEWSEMLVEELDAIGSSSYEFYTYPGDDHNISANFAVAMQRSVDFFDKYVKGQ